MATSLTLDNEGLCAVDHPSNHGKPHVPVLGKLVCDKDGHGGTRCYTCVYCGKMLTVDPVVHFIEWSMHVRY